MNIFCELIKNQLTIIIEEDSLELAVSVIFNEQDLDSIERQTFLIKCSNFLKLKTKNQSFLNRIRSNKVYFRTDQQSETAILNLLDFSNGVLIAGSTKIYES